MEEENGRLKKLHLTEMGGCVNKGVGIVTNLEAMEGDAMIRWHRERCGKSEEVHRILRWG